MQKTMKKAVTFILAIAMTLGLIAVPAAFAGEGDPTLAMSVANKIDVALAVGPTLVEYATFEADLRQALKYEMDGVTPRAHPVPDEDVYIMATKAVSAATTSEFSWWTYDHTRPFYSGEYDGVAVKNDAEHMYSELSTRTTSTASNAYMDAAPNVWGPAGATTSTAKGIGYAYNVMGETNPDPTNPDLAFYEGTNTRRLRHPYQGNNTHMMSSSGGATMDFYGYPQDAFRDWQYLPNDQKTMKTFEFSIAEDLAFDALDGVGFFFNTEVYGSYELGTQKMTGYLLFLQYASGVGNNITIYKFKDVNTRDFHNAMCIGTSSTTQLTVAGYNGTTAAGGTAQFVPVARSTIYTKTDFSRRIRVEASPTSVKVYYKGSTTPKNAAILDPTNPGYVDLDEENLVDFTVTSLAATGLGTVPLQTGKTIIMDQSYIGQDKTDNADYGFGPMAAYLAHGCARPTHIALQNLTMTVEKVKTLTEVVRVPEWHENTIKYLVNLNENRIEDFEENAIIAELLARLTNDDIYYIGWGATLNAIASVAFLRKHSLKGTVLDIDPLGEIATNDDTKDEWAAMESSVRDAYLEQIIEALTYKEQIQAIADEIYKRYWNQNDEGRALNTDSVILSVDGADMQNTDDAIWTSGKWMIKHTIDEETIEITDGVYMTNFEGKFAMSEQYTPDLESPYVFSLPGLYEIFYREVQIGSLYIHRKPVAEFTFYLDEDLPVFVNTSYDPDVYSSSINGTERGIDVAETKWTWINLDDETMTVPELGVPDILIEGNSYIVVLTVTDYWGATSSVTRLVTYGDAESEDVLPPFADFELSPKTFIKSGDPLVQATQKIILKNKSYDQAGRDIESTWTVYLNDVPFPGLTITDLETEYVVGDLPAGSYKITLMVTNDAGVESAEVAKLFDIVEDTIKPTATISPTAPKSFTGNTNLVITFSDTGGSGYKENRYSIVTVEPLDPEPSAPTTGSPLWKLESKGVTRTILINAVGENYVFWEAWDNAGNYNSGVFGPYTMSKKDSTMVLTAKPADGISVIYDTASKQVKLTAALTVGEFDDIPTGDIIFYQETSLGPMVVGSASVSATGTATITCYPKEWGTPATFKAVYSGNADYSPNEAYDTCNVTKNDTATVEVGPQDNKTYDAEPYSPTDITVTGTTYKVEYVGRGGTTYALSTTPPADAGTYTVIVTTNNSNYVEMTDSADFEIYQRELGLVLEADPDESEYGDTVTLTATITNAKELPTGTIEFYVDGTLVDTVALTIDSFDAITELYTCTAESTAWTAAEVGDHDLTAVYVPDSSDNYYAEDYDLEAYNVIKAGQTISFIQGTTVSKTYGDADFEVNADGGLSIYDIEYALINGSSIVTISVVGDIVTVHILGAGQAVIRATQPSDDNYNKATADITINVAKADSALTLTMPLTSIEYGEDIDVSVLTNVSGGLVTCEYEGTGLTSYGPSDEPPMQIGTYKVTGTAAETSNYNEASDTLTFSIVPCTCACLIVPDLTGASITIPYYAVQASCVPEFGYTFASCGNPKHVSDFKYVLSIDPSTPAGIAAIKSGKLVVNDNAVGETVTVKLTLTHLPTGYVESTTAVFTVTKAAKPVDPPEDRTPEENAKDGLKEVDKDDDDEVDVDLSSIGDLTSKTVTIKYKDGPADNADMIGNPLDGDMYDIVDDDTITLTDEFIDTLYAGTHVIEIDVDGETVIFTLYIAPGELMLQVNSGVTATPPLTVEETDDLENTELGDTDNQKRMSKGYDVLIIVNIRDWRNSSEMNEIDTKKGNKLVGPFFDIEVQKIYRDSAASQVTETLKETDPIKFTIEIPVADRGFRNYVVARAHTPDVGGPIEYEPLPTTQAGDFLTFVSDKFSTFAILYDKKVTYIPPDTVTGPDVLKPDDEIKDDEDDKDDGMLTKESDKDAKDNDKAGNGDNAITLTVSEKIKMTLETESHIKYINGYNDGTVRPDNPITRAEVVTIFYRLLKNPNTNNSVENSFSDVDDGSWYATAINCLAGLGIVEGYGDGTFRPDRFITRAEFAAVCSRFDDLSGYGANPFNDVQAGSWSYGSILSAYGKGWVNGYPDNSFKPDATITRAEVITIVNRMLGRRFDLADVPDTLLTLYPDLKVSHWAFADVIEASVEHDYVRKTDGYESWYDFITMVRTES